MPHQGECCFKTHRLSAFKCESPGHRLTVCVKTKTGSLHHYCHCHATQSNHSQTSGHSNIRRKAKNMFMFRFVGCLNIPTIWACSVTSYNVFFLPKFAFVPLLLCIMTSLVRCQARWRGNGQEDNQGTQYLLQEPINAGWARIES